MLPPRWRRRRRRSRKKGARKRGCRGMRTGEEKVVQMKGRRRWYRGRGGGEEG